jgi:hypothetical protein
MLETRRDKVSAALKMLQGHPARIRNLRRDPWPVFHQHAYLRMKFHARVETFYHNLKFCTQV